MLGRSFHLGLAALLVGGAAARAQIDPDQRKLVQVGYNQPLEGKGPLAAYAYLYWNEPNYPRTNQTLRVVIAPTYGDGEWGFQRLLGPHTDLAVGLAGGGFADSFNEIRQGEFLKTESFTGHGGEASVSLYHLVNPAQQIPLNLVLRGVVRYSTYERDDETVAGFELPHDRTTAAVRAGVRWGGRAPELMTPLAMEISLWYEGQYRNNSGAYGLDDDREVEWNTHLFWARALLSCHLSERGQHFSVSVTAGASANTDRFSAYRLGAILPMASEFPLTLPGYYSQEITAERFVLLSAQYLYPLNAAKSWNLNVFGSAARVSYLEGLEQPGLWHTGLGGGLTYQSPNGIWQLTIGYARGFQAIRGEHRGANMVGMAMQWDLDRQIKKGAILDPSWLLDRLRGLEGIFRR